MYTRQQMYLVLLLLCPATLYLFSPNLLTLSVSRYPQFPNYETLEENLNGQRWADANEASTSVIMQVANLDPNKHRILGKSDIEKLSCQHLQFIDTLWSEASEGKFGIRTQVEVWKSIGGTTENYYDSKIVNEYKQKVGWDPLITVDSSSNVDSIPLGHFPAGIIAEGITTPFFMERLEHCDQY